MLRIRIHIDQNLLVGSGSNQIVWIWIRPYKVMFKLLTGWFFFLNMTCGVTKSRFIKAFSLKLRFFKCKKKKFWSWSRSRSEPSFYGWSWSQNFWPGARDEKKNIWSQSQEKCLSSATLVSIAMIFLFKYDMWGDFFQVFWVGRQNPVSKIGSYKNFHVWFLKLCQIWFLTLDFVFPLEILRISHPRSHNIMLA